MIAHCHSLSLVVPLVVICCHSLSFIIIRCHSLSFVVTCCHSLSLVVPLVVIRCHSLYHSLSLDVSLACYFRNDLVRVIIRITSKVLWIQQSFLKPEKSLRIMSNCAIQKSNRSQIFLKIGVLKSFAIFTRKHLRWSPVLETPTQVLSCEYCEIFLNNFI